MVEPKAESILFLFLTCHLQYYGRKRLTRLCWVYRGGQTLLIHTDTLCGIISQGHSSWISVRCSLLAKQQQGWRFPIILIGVKVKMVFGILVFGKDGDVGGNWNTCCTLLNVNLPCCFSNICISNFEHSPIVGPEFWTVGPCIAGWCVYKPGRRKKYFSRNIPKEN